MEICIVIEESLKIDNDNPVTSCVIFWVCNLYVYWHLLLELYLIRIHRMLQLFKQITSAGAVSICISVLMHTN